MTPRRAIFILLCFLSGCSRNPNGPDVAAASFAGTWGGYHRLVSWDPPHSAYQAGTQRAVVIEIAADGASAAITSELPSPHTAAFTSAIQSDGSLVLTPVSAPTVLTAVTRVVLRRLAPGRLTGELTYISDFPSRTFTTTIDQMTRVPARPVRASADALVGSWESTSAQYSLCAGPPLMCSSRFPYPRPAAYTLRIAKNAGAYEAQLVVSHEHGAHRFRTAGSATGDGITFSPVTMPADPDGFVQILSVLQVQATAGGSITGAIEYTTTGPLGSATRRIDILRGDRGDTVRLPGSFQGTWNGRYFVRSCTGDCLGRVSSSGFVSFDLSQRGADIIGSSSLINRLQGSVTGGSAALSGDVTRECGFGVSVTCVSRLSDFTATIDAFGLMQGSFTLERRDSDGSIYTFRGELWDVVRAPSLLK